MTRGPIVFVTGSPAAGKTTLCAALARQFDRTMVVPVDDMRDSWVVQGHAGSVDWSDETERQFQLAEHATCAVAKVYSEGGFTVFIDHCRNLARLDQVVAEHLAGWPVLKVCLQVPTDVALDRNAKRTNKSFDTQALVPIIHHVTAHHFAASSRDGWLVHDNSGGDVQVAVRAVVAAIEAL